MQRLDNIIGSQKTYAILIASFLITLSLPYAFSTGMLVVILLYGAWSLRIHKLDFKPLFWIPILLYVLIVLSLLWTDNLKYSLRGLERQLALILIPVAFGFLPKLTKETRNDALRWYSVGMAVFGLFFIIVALYKYFTFGEMSFFFYHELVAPLELNAIYVSVFVAIAIAFSFFYGKKGVLLFATLGVLLIFLILLSSKSVIAGTFLLIVIGVFMRFRAKVVLIITSLLALLIIGLTVIKNPVKDRFLVEVEGSNLKEVVTCEEFNKVYPWTGTTIRLFQGRIFVEMFKEDKLLFTGYGINNSQNRIEQKHKQYSLWKGYFKYNFHNQYIQAFAELGMVGPLLIILMLLALFKQFFRTKDIMFLSVFLIMAIVFVSESYIWRQRGLFHFLILYCLLFKTTINLKKEVEP